VKVVWTNGCFDLLHEGHVRLLNFAKSSGDYLVVGVNSDRMIREMKGLDRPIYSENQRVFLLQNIRAVDEVVLFDSQQMLDTIIKDISPRSIIVGSDYKDKEVIGSNYCDNVLFFDRISNISTSRTLDRIGKSVS
tara:strand:+ start:127 stop:531 length:405 start_codon:yes stop_codon:yes gene_type:complete